MKKDEIRKIYIDTSLLHDWFARLMRNEKDPDTDSIKFLRDRKDVDKFISIFTIAELVESLLFHEKGIRDYMKKLEVIESFSKLFMQTTGVKVIEFEKEGEHKGIFISPKPLGSPADEVTILENAVNFIWMSSLMLSSRIRKLSGITTVLK